MLLRFALTVCLFAACRSTLHHRHGLKMGSTLTLQPRSIDADASAWRIERQLASSHCFVDVHGSSICPAVPLKHIPLDSNLRPLQTPSVDNVPRTDTTLADDSAQPSGNSLFDSQQP